MRSIILISLMVFTFWWGGHRVDCDKGFRDYAGYQLSGCTDGASYGAVKDVKVW